MAVGIMMNLHSIFCSFNANSYKLFVLLEPNSSLFQHRLLTMTALFEIAVRIERFSKKGENVNKNVTKH